MSLQEGPDGAQRPPRLTWNIVEVAAALGVCKDTFQKHRTALERAGFPRPLPALAGLWSRAAVTDWIETSALSWPPGPEPDPVAAAAGGTVVGMREHLERKYAGR